MEEGRAYCTRSLGEAEDCTGPLGPAGRGGPRHPPALPRGGPRVPDRLDGRGLPAGHIPVYPAAGPAKEIGPVPPFPKGLKPGKHVPPPPPTRGEVRRAVRAWLQRAHPDAKHVTLESFTERGIG